MTRAESSPGVRAVVALLIVALAATLIAPVAVGAEHVDHVDSAVVDGETNPAVESFSGHSQGDPGPAAQTAGDDADVIRLRNELAQTDERGTVGVTTRAEIPDRVTELEVTLLSAADGDADIEADGFVPADDAGPDESVWEWDGDTADPSLTYAIDANDTIEEEGPLAADGAYRFVDAGEWALVRTPASAPRGRTPGSTRGRSGSTVRRSPRARASPRSRWRSSGHTRSTFERPQANSTG